MMDARGLMPACTPVKKSVMVSRMPDVTPSSRSRRAPRSRYAMRVVSAFAVYTDDSRLTRRYTPGCRRWLPSSPDDDEGDHPTRRATCCARVRRGLVGGAFDPSESAERLHEARCVARESHFDVGRLVRQVASILFTVSMCSASGIPGSSRRADLGKNCRSQIQVQSHCRI